MQYDKLIIGGGVVGLATALAIREKDPGCRMAVLEKESGWALHQSSRNSGVIHAGVYYKPGSKKAEFARRGNASMYAFCAEHNIPYERCGKLIIATNMSELPGLKNLYKRSKQNNIEVSMLSATEAKEIEPHIKCVSALKVPSTGIVDFQEVAQKYAELLESLDVDLRTNCEVLGIEETKQGYQVATNRGVFETKFLISAAGLYADKMVNKASLNPEMQIVPFRGEYWHLKSSKHHLVKNLIYPVPNPKFPFLGVHMTRLIDGSVHAGPNAVLAFAREGYSWGKFKIPEIIETLSFPGFWRLAGTYLGEGAKEMYRSAVKSAFLKSVQSLIPEIQGEDLVRGDAGVRAQALRRDGSLIEDFHLLERKNAIFVLNAPSPAATASLEIGKYLAGKSYQE